MIDLFDHAARRQEADEAKKSAMAQSEKNANPRWSECMLIAVRLTCLEQHQFSADDIFDHVDDHGIQTHDTRAFGPVMNKAAKLGYCQKTDRIVPSRRKSNHARPVAIWQSLIYRP